MRLLVIGGSDAGIRAGLAAKQQDRQAEVTLLVADTYPNFSICGIPYHVSGDVPDWRHLAHRSTADLEQAGLTLRLVHRATAIDPDHHTVTATSGDGATTTLPYDRLMIGTGAVPARPPIDGLDRLGPADGVHVLHTMGDTLADHLTAHGVTVRRGAAVKAIARDKTCNRHLLAVATVAATLGGWCGVGGRGGGWHGTARQWPARTSHC